MLNQVQHDNGSEFSVTLNHVLNQVQDLRFQGLMVNDTSVLDYGLWKGGFGLTDLTWSAIFYFKKRGFHGTKSNHP
jgi:hypothetical protein